MPFELCWEPRGVLRRYLGDVSIEERLRSFELISGDPRFGDLRYSITDYLAVRNYEIRDEATQEIAALHVAPVHTNPHIVIAAVAVEPRIVAAIEHFISLRFTTRPYRIFATEQSARTWVADPWAEPGPSSPPRPT